MYSIFSFLPFLNTGIIPTLVSLLIYAGLSVGIFLLAKKLGMKAPARAFVPVLRLSMLGRMADDYLAETRGKTTKYRILLPILVTASEIAGALALFATYVVLGIYFVGFFSGYILLAIGSVEEIYAMVAIGYLIVMATLIFFVAVVPVINAVSQTAAVVSWISLVWVLYPVYKKCSPENSTLYTVLTILFNFAAAVILPYAAIHYEAEEADGFDAYLEAASAEA